MKNLMFMLSCFCFLQIHGQKQADYDNAIAKFIKFYNADQADSICNMFSNTWGEKKKTLWIKEDITELKEKYGEIKSFKYMDIEPRDSIYLYKTVGTKKIFATGVSLDENNKMLTFRFSTTSPFIKKLLKKN